MIRIDINDHCHHNELRQLCDICPLEARIAALEAENAELRQRLAVAIELPFDDRQMIAASLKDYTWHFASQDDQKRDRRLEIASRIAALSPKPVAASDATPANGGEGE